MRGVGKSDGDRVYSLPVAPPQTRYLTPPRTEKVQFPFKKEGRRNEIVRSLGRLLAEILLMPAWITPDFAISLKKLLI